jgi:hypothetical protein
MIEKKNSSLNSKPSLTKVRATIEHGSFAASLALEAMLQAGVRSSKLAKYMRALELLGDLTNLSVPVLSDTKAFKEALDKRPTMSDL